MATIEELEKRVARLEARSPFDSKGFIKGAPAGDKLLTGEYGDPKIFFDPRGWTGESYKGKKCSEAPPEYLDMYAEAKATFARIAEEKGETLSNGKPKASYEWMDVSKIRGWARKHREDTLPF